MNKDKKIKLNEENIRKGLDAYWEYTDHNYEIRNIVSNNFIHRLAVDNVESKDELRKLFRKSPVWNEELDAIVINGKRTHNPDPDCIEYLIHKILINVWPNCNNQRIEDFGNMLAFFKYKKKIKDKDHQKYEKLIESINRIAPDAYRPGRKISRIFRSICDHLGVSDERAGSVFQKLYAKLADELLSKKIDFKLYLSLNPAHFLTMSNPKEDDRGEMLTSCHSLNTTEYEYNNGCIGYARDKYTFIVFTADGTDPDSLCNRKTSRQIFAYKPYNGLLLQSRLYNTDGGTSGYQEVSDVYRDLVQREISSLENAINLWRAPIPYCSENNPYKIERGMGFGGYTDWTYSDFDAKISIRKDSVNKAKVFTVGTYGLCLDCGNLNGRGLFCNNCTHICEECDELCDDLIWVTEYNGESAICQDCFDNGNYVLCDCCDKYFDGDLITKISNGNNLCENCRDDQYTMCSCCGEYVPDKDINNAYDIYNNEIDVCDDCLKERFTECHDCGEYYEDICYINTKDGEIKICDGCEESYESCDECGIFFKHEDLEDGLCEDCRKTEHENNTGVGDAA